MSRDSRNASVRGNRKVKTATHGRRPKLRTCAFRQALPDDPGRRLVAPTDFGSSWAPPTMRPGRQKWVPCFGLSAEYSVLLCRRPEVFTPPKKWMYATATATAMPDSQQNALILICRICLI